MTPDSNTTSNTGTNDFRPEKDTWKLTFASPILQLPPPYSLFSASGAVYTPATAP